MLAVSGVRGSASSNLDSGPGERNPCLDGIRGIAILLVILGHTFQFTFAHSFLGRIVTGVAGIGWIGVDLFFALSGFLITGILLRLRGAPSYFKVFYMRRFFRIFPVYYAFLAGISLVYFLIRPDLLSRLQLPWMVPYLANVLVALHGFPYRAVDHLWSLSVEEQFYLIWPAALLLIPRRNTTRVILFLFAALVGVRFWTDWQFHPRWEFDYALLHIDALLGGAALASFSQGRQLSAELRRIAWTCFAASVMVLGAWFYATGSLNRTMFTGKWTANYAVVAAASVALIAVSIWSPAQAVLNRVLSLRVLVQIGKYSYAMYIFHLPVDSAFRLAKLAPAEVWPSVAYFLLVTAITYGIAQITWRLIENPCLLIKERWFPYQRSREVSLQTL